MPCDTDTIRIIMIAAMSRNNVIGYKGDLPWRMSDDLKFFKKTTLHHPVIMGRTTFMSIKKALPARDNIVLTTDRHFTAQDVTPAHDVKEAITKARTFASHHKTSDIYVIGGASLYRQFLPFAHQIYITKIDTHIDQADSFFPPLDTQNWHATTIGAIQKNVQNDYSARICHYQRRLQQINPKE